MTSKTKLEKVKQLSSGLFSLSPSISLWLPLPLQALSLSPYSLETCVLKSSLSEAIKLERPYEEIM